MTKEIIDALKGLALWLLLSSAFAAGYYVANAGYPLLQEQEKPDLRE